MSEFTFFMRCPRCGAKNRVRLVIGKRVRVRCGSCNEPLQLDKKRVLALTAWQGTKRFFAHRLPNALVAVVELLLKMIGVLISPLRMLWRRLPLGVRNRLGWILLAVLAVSYLVVEGTLKFSSMLVLAALLVLAMTAVMVAARGPLALRQMMGNVIRNCPSCGHRYFGWLKSCPRCGSDHG